MVTFQTRKELDNPLLYFEPGEIAWIEDEKEFYVWNKGWKAMNIKSDGLELNLYDMNKQIISQLPIYNQEQIKDMIDSINKMAESSDNKYFMLYGKEISYFTLFSRTGDNLEYDNLGLAVVDCLQSVGELVSLSENQVDNALEIWVKQKENVTCLYLFEYDKGVVTFRG
jgi:hypothetical protein